MTLREYYAGLAMQGILSNPITEGGELADSQGREAFGDACVNAADALIAALAKASTEEKPSPPAASS